MLIGQDPGYFVLAAHKVRSEHALIGIASCRNHDVRNDGECFWDELVVARVVDIHAIAVKELDLELCFLLPVIEAALIVLDVINACRIYKPANRLHTASRGARAETGLRKASDEIGPAEKSDFRIELFTN